MARFRVLFTARARRELLRAGEWWRANRSKNPELFADEVAGTIDRIAAAPDAGIAIPSMRVQGLRRWFMPGTRYHVYYTVDAAAGTVVVRSVWHGTRGKGPKLD